MVKNHIKRMAVPITWAIRRKGSTFVTRPRGYLQNGLPISLILTELLGIAKTSREAHAILNSGKIKLDGKQLKDGKTPAILMSVLSINGEGDYRMLISKLGKLFLKKLDGKEKTLKPAKITRKTPLHGGKIQLGFHDGRTMLQDKEAKVNDTILFELPSFKPVEHLKLEKGATVYLTGGSNVGQTGKVENVTTTVAVKLGDLVIETGKENVLVIGKESAEISVE